MCLTIDSEITKRLKAKNDFLAYKIYLVGGDSLYSPYMSAEVEQAGDLFAYDDYGNKVKTSLDETERARNRIEFGIHVYLNRKNAQRAAKNANSLGISTRVVIPVRVNSKHLRAAGTFIGQPSAAFSRINISERAFKNAFAEAKKVRERQRRSER